MKKTIHVTNPFANPSKHSYTHPHAQRKQRTPFHPTSWLVSLWACGAFLCTFGIIAFLFWFVFSQGLQALSWDFLTQAPKGSVLGTEGGILPAILGSLYYTLIAVCVASVLGIATAIHQVFYCRNAHVRTFVSLCMHCMAGAPSIVIGLFGYALLVLALGWGKCLLAGGITLAIMITPYIAIQSEKALREVDPHIIASSYALGISRSHTIVHIVLPEARRSIISSLILGGCYAVGAAAPLIFTGAVILAQNPTSIMKPAMALPYHLFMLLTQGNAPANAYGTACVMMILVLIANGIATTLSMRKR